MPEFNPFASGAAKRVSTPAQQPTEPAFNPFKTGRAYRTNPDDIHAQIAADPLYVPSNEELRTIFDAQENKTFGQKAAEVAKGVIQTPGAVARDAIGAFGEVAKKPDLEHTGRLTSTALDAIANAAAGTVEFVYKPLKYLTTTLPQDLGDPEGKFDRWKMGFLQDLARSRSSVSEDFQKSVLGLRDNETFAPYPQASRTGALALQLLPGATGPAKTALAASENAALSRAITGPIQAAERGLPAAEGLPAVSKASLGEKAAATTGKAVSATGHAVETVAGWPKEFSQWLAEKVSGSPELAKKLGDYVNLGELTSVPTAVLTGAPVAKAVAAVKAAETAGAVAGGLGDFMARVAEADRTNPFGKLVALGRDTSAPAWMRGLAGSPPVKFVAAAGRLGLATAKSAAKGAVTGAAYGVLSGDNSEELGQDIGFFAGFGAVHGASAARRTRILQANMGNVARLVTEHLDEGVSPETLKSVKTSTMVNAAILEKILNGYKIRFSRPSDAGSPFAKGQIAERQAGWFDRGRKTLWIQPDARDAETVLLHEAYHALFDSEVSSRPDIQAAVETAVQKQGRSIDLLKKVYAYEVLKGSLRGVKDPTEIARKIDQFVTEQDSSDPTWVYSEMLSEAAANALYGKDIVGIADAGIAAKSLEKVRELLSGLNVEFKDQSAKPKTILPGFEKSIDSPELRKLTYKLLRAQKKFLPGLDKPVEQAVKLTTQDMGGEKAPFHKLPDGREINPYGTLVDDGRGGKKFVKFPASEIRRRLQAEQKALDKYFPKGTDASQVPAAFWTDPEVAPWTKAALKQVQDAIQNQTSLEGFYHRLNSEDSATSKKSWRADVARSAGNVQVSLQSGFPLSVKRTKAGNLVVEWASLEAARQKSSVWANRHGDLSLDLWGGDQAAFQTDSQTYLANHKQGLPGESNGIGQQKRDVLNAFWFGDNKEFQAKNPLRGKIRGSDRKGVFRSLRVDRLETLHPAETGLARPEWQKGKINFSPEAEARMKAEIDARNAQKKEILLAGPDGRNYRATHDGDMDFSALGKGKVAQYTALEDIPGLVKTGSTTYAPAVERAGYRLSNTPEAVAESILNEAGNEHAKQFSPTLEEWENRNKKPSPEEERKKAEAVKASYVKKDLSVVHYSDAPSVLDKIDPKFMRKSAGRTGQWWASKPARTFFYVAGSDKGADMGKFVGRTAYTAKLDGKKIYDATGDDPAGFFDKWPATTNDREVLKHGYEGVLISAENGTRKVVIMFKPVEVKLNKAKTKALRFSPEVEAKQGRKEPNEEVRKVAEDYMKQTGLPYQAHTGNQAINEPLAKRIADFYQDAQHTPEDPAVQAAYKAFADETIAQWNAITAKGVSMEPWTKEGQPYKNSAEMMQDVRDNKHLWFFPTEGGFGSTEGPATHPLLAKTGIIVDGMDLPVNDVFRAVHDYFGHSKEGYEFGPRGELNAFLSHVRMYSDAAKPAMAAETLGQNSWVNFGKHLRDAEGNIPKKGEKGFVPATERPFAEQKATVLPPELIDPVVNAKTFSPATEAGRKLEKEGYEFSEENFGTGIINFSLSKDGDWVADLTAHQTGPKTANLDKIVVSLRQQNKGIGEVLYRELADRLQKAGVTELEGDIVHPAPKKLREKLFGPVMDRDGKSVSLISRVKQFSPADEKAPVYNSQLEKVVDEKFSGERMPAAQLAAILRNPNHSVKAEELKWSGLDDFLKGRGRVSKQEVQQFLQDNRLEIKEVIKGSERRPYSREDAEQIEDIAQLDYGRSFAELTPDEQTAVRDQVETQEYQDTKFPEYQLPGGENYREILFQLPENQYPDTAPQGFEIKQSKFGGDVWDVYSDGKQVNGTIHGKQRAVDWAWEQTPEKQEPFKSHHFDEPNILAHTRVNDRVDSEGKPGLFIEEIQSDWHQKGRKEGYKVNLTEAERELDDLIKRIDRNGFKSLTSEERARKHELVNQGVGESLLSKTGKEGVPDAPLKKTWHEFVFRRLVRQAAEEGKDWVGWTTGEQQSARYDLSKHVDSIQLINYPAAGKDMVLLSAHNGEDRVIKEVIPQTKIADYIGKEAAEKLLSRPANDLGVQEISGLDLKVGGEGMKGFYDKILVDYANKFGKKFGAKVEKRDLGGVNQDAQPHFDPDTGKDIYPSLEVHSLSITSEMKKSVLEKGISIFSPADEAPKDNKVTGRYASRVASLTAKDGGTTFNVATGKSLTEKPYFVVSIYPDRSLILDPKEVTPQRIGEFIHANRDLLSDKDNSLGTWNDPESGKVYIDVSFATPDRKFAEYAGWKYNQKAIWDLQKSEGVETGGSGEPLEHMAPATERLALLRDEFEQQHPQSGQQQLTGLGRVVLDPRSEEVKNVRDLEAVRPNRELTPTERAASDLARRELRERVQLLPNVDDRVKVRRAIQQGLKEATEFMEKQASNPTFDSGKDWYRKDIEKMEETTRLIFPETKDPNKMTMFKVLLAAFSGGAKPKENYQLASEAFSQYLKTGEVPASSPFRVSEEGVERKLGRQADMTAEKLSKMIAALGGEGPFVNYLLSKHPQTILGNTDAYGALDLGPKFGRFFLNLAGHDQEVTVDLWATRTWNRWMGTPFKKVEGKMKMPDIPTEPERVLIIEAFSKIADEISKDLPPDEHVEPMDIQAVLWFYEKDLFTMRGVKVDRGSFSKAAEAYAKNPIHKRNEPVVTGAKIKTDKNQLTLLP